MKLRCALGRIQCPIWWRFLNPSVPEHGRRSTCGRALIQIIDIDRPEDAQRRRTDSMAMRTPTIEGIPPLLLERVTLGGSLMHLLSQKAICSVLKRTS